MYSGIIDYYKVSKEAERDFPNLYRTYGTEAIYNFITFNYIEKLPVSDTL